MIGLAKIPSAHQIQAVYTRFQERAGLPVSEPEFALWSQWSRFDPRLAEQWVEAVARTFSVGAGTDGNCGDNEPVQKADGGASGRRLRR